MQEDPSFLIDRMSDEMIQQQFIDSADTMSLIALSKEDLVGFVSGTIDKDNNKAYITILLVDPNHQQQGIGTTLLQHLEHQILVLSPDTEHFDIVFHNPVSLSWTSSKHPYPTHPMLPGVPARKPLMQFFATQGYEKFATQELYYRDIHNHEMRDHILAKEHALATNDIKIVFYDSKVHSGLEELFNDLGSISWKETVMNGLKKEYPLLVVTKKDRVIGFAGPLYVEDSGRGYFAGIGVHKTERNQGIASVLFARLCHSLSKMNGSYMTLFTGTNNPAKYIYLKEGFQVIHTFVNYRKKV